MYQNIEIALMKTQSREFRISDGQKVYIPTGQWPYTARVAYTQLCECPWVAQPEPGLEPNQIFLEKPENVFINDDYYYYCYYNY